MHANRSMYSTCYYLSIQPGFLLDFLQRSVLSYTATSTDCVRLPLMAQAGENKKEHPQITYKQNTLVQEGT